MAIQTKRCLSLVKLIRHNEGLEQSMNLNRYRPESLPSRGKQSGMYRFLFIEEFITRFRNKYAGSLMHGIPIKYQHWFFCVPYEDAAIHF